MHRPPKVALVTALCAMDGLSTGCNRYMLFNQAGYEQSSFNDDADILFVVDNSGSMSEETAALAANFGSFLEVLTSDEGAAQVTETLTDAVENYVTYTQDRGRFLDYRMAITTATGDELGDGILAPGEGGTFIGDSAEDAIISKDDPDVEARFLDLLICDTGYWDNPPIGGTGTLDSCETLPEDGVITQEFLNCFCGDGAWDNPAGTGQEQHLESALMALCRASDDPPDVCFESVGIFEDTQQYTNPGFLRDGATAVIVIVTDEGDAASPRFVGADTDPAPYLEAFAEFDRPIKVVTIGPHFEVETGNVYCGSQGSGTPPLYAIERLYGVSNDSGGFYSFINEPVTGSDCENTDFSVPLRDLGALLVNLDTAFQLQSVPDVSTIQVWIDGEEVPKASLVSGEAGGTDAEYDQGWSYDPSQNAVSFWGSWVPDFNADVEIFYRPLEGRPRDLPF